MIKLILLGLIIFGAFFLGGAYFNKENTGKDAIGGVGPDSIFYYFDTASEWVQLNILTRDESKKIELKLALMQERLNELSDLENLKRMSQENVERIKEGYNSLADSVIEALKKKAKDTADEQAKALAQKASDVVAKQQESINNMLEQAPDSVKEPVKGILGVIQDAYRRAVDIIKE